MSYAAYKIVYMILYLHMYNVYNIYFFYENRYSMEDGWLHFGLDNLSELPKEISERQWRYIMHLLKIKMVNFTLGEFNSLSWTTVVGEHQHWHSNNAQSSFFITVSSVYGAFRDISWAEKDAKRKSILH